MKTSVATLLKLYGGVYLLLTSFYSLLAYLPYTYHALVKAPPYAWMAGFVHYHVYLYWLALLTIILTDRLGDRTGFRYALFALLTAVGVFVSVHPFLTEIHNDGTAYIGALVALWTLAIVAQGAFGREPPKEKEGTPFVFSIAVGVAALVSMLYTAGAHLRTYSETRTLQFHASDAELALWSVLSHVVVALLFVSVVNLLWMSAGKSARPITLRRALLGMLIFGGLWLATARFLASALSFDGWQAHLYAASLALSLTLFGFSLSQPFLVRWTEDVTTEGTKRVRRRLFLGGIAAGLAVATIALPTWIAGADWNGILQRTFTLMLWLVFSICACGLFPRRRKYRLATLGGVLLLSLISYSALHATAILWAKPLGSTDDEITRSIEKYETRDVSFDMVNQLLGNDRTLPCGELCRIMREYTNIRDARVAGELKLADPLLPTSSVRPNIFIFVIDSLRPDYLRAYNPHVDFTPHLDQFAQDSTVIRNVYTQYAGTSLSEPAIWAGALLLHTHNMQSFENLNSLARLAKTDGYLTVVSTDEVLREMLKPSSDMVVLDADITLWNHLEVCSTIRQTIKLLDQRSDQTRPVFFYSQPKNVHQFANNGNPTLATANWIAPSGFSGRIALEVHQVDDCVGAFFSYLKGRGLYDSSIIILTSDHGDATGEFGRFSHSTSIFPEIMRVPLIVHLPKKTRDRLVYDDNRVSTLTDITPSLYYLLGHRPVVHNPVAGRPLFMETPQELTGYRRDELFLASDVRAAYGVLADNGRYLYATYDSPAQSYLFDLSVDPNGEHNIVTEQTKRKYDERIIENLRTIADFYGYKPRIGSWFSGGSSP